MRTRSKVGVVCCGLVLVVAGCGGAGERLSAQQYARAAGEVCARANRAAVQFERAAPRPDDAVARALVEVVMVHRVAIEDLRDLRPPEVHAATTQRWIALLDQAVDELQMMREHLRAGDVAGAQSYGAKATILFERARELVAPLQVPSCEGPDLVRSRAGS